MAQYGEFFLGFSGDGSSNGIDFTIEDLGVHFAVQNDLALGKQLRQFNAFLRRDAEDRNDRIFF